MTTLMLPPNTTLNPDHSVTYQLLYPVDVNGATLSKLIIRRPRVQDSIDRDTWKHQGKSNLQVDVHYFSNLTGQAPDVISRLDAIDYMALGELLTFFTTPPATTSPS